MFVVEQELPSLYTLSCEREHVYNERVAFSLMHLYIYVHILFELVDF